MSKRPLPRNLRKISANGVLRASPPLGLRPERPFTGVSGPSGPEIPKKSQKNLPGPPGPECPKSLEKSQKVSEKSLFDTFLRLWTLRAGRPGETF